ncbi:DUF1194 domain-containing protein [Pelagibius litoralis]|uniref:DUF1194 domain-containing protein n=1 Tax=Pelagibius litoralis TaxID=374515 RepID=A0A967C9P4_9PROT|nr:DUF1194 domain-containing protein [Pelagibius litoralis]NIA67078.1 DUF1194 domain-containing protein [Pelagibius litoralis]
MTLFPIRAVAAILAKTAVILGFLTIPAGLARADDDVSDLRRSLAQSAGPAQVVDLELVLAVDASSSVSAEEFDLQMRGFADAFRDPAVAAAIRATGELGVAIAMIQWSDNRRQHVAIDWQHLTTPQSTEAYAEVIDSTPRFLDGGGTAIGGAIEFGVRAIERNGFEGVRKVIDISGDGRANQGAQPAKLRDLAVLQGVTINGLAILNEDSSVDSYYRTSVIGGTGAFVMTANNYEDFAAAMLEKLIKEIGAVPIAEGPIEVPEAPGGTQLTERPVPAERGFLPGY